MKKILFYADAVNLRFPGYRKILEPLLARLDGEIITHPDEARQRRNSDIVIIPFGVITSYQCAGDNLDLSYLVDAPSLCFKSVALFYVRRRRFWHPELWFNILRYIKYLRYESKIIHSYRLVFVASHHDAAYLNNKYKQNNVVAIENGVTLPVSNSIRPRSTVDPGNIRLGYLNFWGAGRPYDFEWFVEDILPILRKKFPGLSFVVAGRGIGPELEAYFRYHGVDNLGEVDNLGDFFDIIDIFVTSVRKECGILNKVLDAFAHQRIVIGYEGNMHSFPANVAPFFYTYRNATELIYNIQRILSHPDEVEQRVDHALAYLKEHHDWDKQSSRFRECIEQLRNA